MFGNDECPILLLIFRNDVSPPLPQKENNNNLLISQMDSNQWVFYQFPLKSSEEKKNEIWHNPMTTPRYTNGKFKNRRTIHKRHQNFDYTTIADRLWTVSWSNNSHPTGLVKPVYGYHTFQLTTKAVSSSTTNTFIRTVHWKIHIDVPLFVFVGFE